MPKDGKLKARKRIRNAVKAIIYRDGKLLVIRKQDTQGAFAALPGGGQKKGETLVQVLKRECLEELGARVKVGDLVYVRDYISANHAPYHPDMPLHKVEFYFLCEIKGKMDLGSGHRPDPAQQDVVWADPSHLEALNFYPHVMRKILTDLEAAAQSPVYLGDVN